MQRKQVNLSRATALALAFGVAAGAQPAAADVAPAQKVKVLLTALSFNRSLKERAGDKLNIGVVGACDTATALGEAAGKSINGLPIAIEELGDYKGEGELAGAVKAKNVSVIYVCAAPGDGINGIVAVAKKQNVVTLADKAEWVEDKLVLGVGDKDGRPELVLNVNAAKAAGAEFDPRIFGVARVVK